MKIVKRKPIKILSFILLLVSVDLVSKIIAHKLGVGFVNTGISWGLAQNMPIWFSLSISILLNGALIWALAGHYDRKIPLYSLVVILSGGLGNTVSRVIWGGVWDWISIWEFPSFNFADMLISIGTALFIFSHIGYDARSNISIEK